MHNRCFDKFNLLHGLIKKTSPWIKNDKLYLSLRYYFLFWKKLNWNNPLSFSEKIQWLKLYNRKPEYTIMVDKVKVKKWVAEKIGEEYIIPTLGVWDNADDIDFKMLPNRFVIKCNHNSGLGMCICKDKSTLDISSVREGLRRGLCEDYYLKGREWPYKNVSRKIIAEQFMEDAKHPGDLIDYKFFCFDGEPKFCQVIRDRTINETIDIYDTNWNLLPFVGLNPQIKNSKILLEKPIQLEKMLDICRILSKELSFCRVDLYVINGSVYFGEITFSPLSGFGQFTPIEWNEIIGSWITLP